MWNKKSEQKPKETCKSCRKGGLRQSWATLPCLWIIQLLLKCWYVCQPVTWQASTCGVATIVHVTMYKAMPSRNAQCVKWGLMCFYFHVLVPRCRGWADALCECTFVTELCMIFMSLALCFSLPYVLFCFALLKAGCVVHCEFLTRSLIFKLFCGRYFD